jgi:hypothetical protein
MSPFNPGIPCGPVNPITPCGPISPMSPFNPGIPCGPGGYDPLTEDATVGVNRALKFSTDLDQVDTQLLEKASTIISSSTSIGANQTALRITFIADINVRN